ncbi:MAG: site-specific DNA-methyltransferase [Selenomonadaceae bacterium]|nr:site-specific DNA-methyltransferase [Selenomonadaceae bacterium]
MEEKEFGTNFFEHLMEVLKQDERFFSVDGNILRNAIIEFANKFDAQLLKILLSDDDVKKFFFVDVDGVKVFDKDKFTWVINNREFLPDSYTSFKNKIGLVDEGGNFIAESKKVALVFPYKDCVLEGGQTKDEQKRDEIFYNEILAPEDIDRLLYPKVFTGAKKFSADGVEDVTSFSDTDNLIIKGNNLLAVASLLKRFSNKVKCIYIDVPYNTGNDSFGYNDRFNHSTWLTFMKNRLEQAKKLLRSDGIVLIQIDDNEQAYLKVLCDEIFGRQNFLTTFYVQVRYPNKTLKEDMNFHKEIEQIHIYQKSSEASPNLNTTEFGFEKFIYRIEEKELPFRTIELGGKKVEIFNKKQYEIKTVTGSKYGLKEVWATGTILDGNSSGRFFRDFLADRYLQDGYGVLYKVYGIGDDIFDHRYFTGPQRVRATKGKYYQGVPIDKFYSEKNSRTLPIENFYDFAANFGNCRHEGGIDFRAGKKPEILIATILKHFTNEGDIVLDNFLGSGTTAAVAHKMKRQYIGVEQMNYIETVTVERLKKVIEGEQGGISKAVNWQGGGSFVYCELAKQNQKFVEEIETARGFETIRAIYKKMVKSGFISYKVKPADIEAAAKDFEELSIENQKKFLMELLDKNLLYVNYCDIDDEEFGITDADKKFTRSFYGEG